ncbi:MAG: hypothetical protein ACC707_12450 [Thiohalomonadales bacterium]
MKSKQADHNKKIKIILDQAAQNLSTRHAARLDKMTENAEAYYIDKKQHRHRLWHQYQFKYNHLTLPIVMASSALFVLWLIGSNWQGTRLHNDPIVASTPLVDTAVPGWVLDTKVPISLLKNSAFYDWLAEQEEANKHG